MRRWAIAMLGVGIILGLAARTQADSDDEAQAILTKAFKAHMPKGLDKTKRAYLGKNKGKLSVQGLELEFTQQIWTQPGGKFKETMELSVMGQNVSTVTVFNGKEGWIKVNNMDIPVKDEILDEFKEVGYMMSIGQLTGLKEQGMKFSLLGEADVNGKKAIGVKISKEGKKDIDLYFDKTTGLMAKIERRAKDLQSGQEATEERIITGYKEVEGRQMPKHVQVRKDGKTFLEAEVIEARFVERHDDSEFAKP